MKHTFKFTLEGVGVNPHYESRDFYFVNYLLETVAKTFYTYKLTAYHLQQEKKSWIISDIYVEHFGKPLKWMDEIEVQLGFRNTKGLRVAIDFEVYHKEKRMAIATMQWTVIDEIKRRPMAHPLVEEKLPRAENLPFEGFKFPRLKGVDISTGFEQEVTYSVIDFNHHLNAYQYFRFAYDALATNFKDKHYPVKFQAKFEREIMLSDVAKVNAHTQDLHSDIQILRCTSSDDCSSFKLSVDWAKR